MQRFEEDGILSRRGFTSATTLVRGSYDQRGNADHARSRRSTSGILPVRDGMLVMADGTLPPGRRPR